MIYRDVSFDTQQDSTSIAKKNNFETVHIPYSDSNENIHKGKGPTQITTTAIVYSESEKNTLEGLLHSSDQGVLEFGSRYYKKVEVGNNVNPTPITGDKKDIWTIEITFVALDPIPYDAETGDALYD